MFFWVKRSNFMEKMGFSQSFFSRELSIYLFLGCSTSWNVGSEALRRFWYVK